MEQSNGISPADAVRTIRAFKGDKTAFFYREKGFIEWTFGQLARYRGYEGALEYVRFAEKQHAGGHAWVNNCRLLITYRAYLLAAEQVDADDAANNISSQ